MMNTYMIWRYARTTTTAITTTTTTTINCVTFINTLERVRGRHIKS